MEITLDDQIFRFNYKEHVPYTREQLLLLYWQNHPRYRFLKTCKNGNFLDLGCGDGGLQFWLQYGEPLRNDIKMYAVDISRGEYVDRYEQFVQFDLNQQGFPYEQDFFDNIYSAHVFEYIEKPSVLAAKLGLALKPGGKIYIEIPNHFSVKSPTIKLFQKAGITWAATTTNFYDDKTHRQPYSAEEIIQMFNADLQDQYQVKEHGTVWNDYLMDFMLSYAYDNKDTEIWTYAVWLHYQWSDYAVLEKMN